VYAWAVKGVDKTKHMYSIPNQIKHQSHNTTTYIINRLKMFQNSNIWSRNDVHEIKWTDSRNAVCHGLWGEDGGSRIL
jgi:hypothetical protein